MTILDDFKKNFINEETNKIHIGKVVSSLIIIFILVGFILYKNRSLESEARDRSAHSMYTIGVTGDKNHNFKSSQPTLSYYYEVLGQKYKGLEHVAAKYETTALPNGRRYYVQFSYKNPKNSKLLLEYPVPDSILISPDTGWLYIPGYMEKK